ncbi:MAG: hypothetical protein ACRDZO_20930 [Egibacteraceae bacterium]
MTSITQDTRPEDPPVEVALSRRVLRRLLCWAALPMGIAAAMWAWRFGYAQLGYAPIGLFILVGLAFTAGITPLTLLATLVDSTMRTSRTAQTVPDPGDSV